MEALCQSAAQATVSVGLRDGPALTKLKLTMPGHTGGDHSLTVKVIVTLHGCDPKKEENRKKRAPIKFKGRPVKMSTRESWSFSTLWSDVWWCRLLNLPLSSHEVRRPPSLITLADSCGEIVALEIS